VTFKKAASDLIKFLSQGKDGRVCSFFVPTSPLIIENDDYHPNLNGEERAWWLHDPDFKTIETDEEREAHFRSKRYYR
jgi:hypothetical protein